MWGGSLETVLIGDVFHFVKLTIITSVAELTGNGDNLFWLASLEVWNGFQDTLLLSGDTVAGFVAI